MLTHANENLYILGISFKNFQLEQFLRCAVFSDVCVQWCPTYGMLPGDTRGLYDRVILYSMKFNVTNIIFSKLKIVLILK